MIIKTEETKMSYQKKGPKIIPQTGATKYYKARTVQYILLSAFYIKPLYLNQYFIVYVIICVSQLFFTNEEKDSFADPTYVCNSLQKDAYSNILNISPSKTESFLIKNSDNFQIYAQNLDCGYPLKPPQ